MTRQRNCWLRPSMRSPRFSIRKQKLRRVFTSGSLKSTWKEKIRPSLRNRYLLDPIEHLDFHINLNAECLRIESLICDGRYQPATAVRVLMEKSKGLCRQIVIPSLQDAIILQRLSDALYADIRGKSPSKRSFFEPEDHSFSKIQRDEHGAPKYGSLRAWLNFQKGLLKFAANREYIVVTDLANYYDFISYSHLRNIVSGHIDVEESILDTLIFILSGLLWQPDYMPRAEIGLPQIDIDASRILAHCFLYDLDEYLEKQKGLDFVRYMDDVDLGVDTILDARRMLRDIDLILHTRQVRLNSGKTKILTKEEARRHFCVRENSFLDLLRKRIERKLEKSQPLTYERKNFEKFFEEVYRKSDVFIQGNGEKILKRSLTMARKISAGISRKTLSDILIKFPSCRENVFSYISSKLLNNARMLSLLRFLIGGRIVDEVSIMLTIECAVDARALRSAHLITTIGIVTQRLLQNRGIVEIYAALWLCSKYKSPAEIIDILKDTVDFWRVDATLGRLVGGLCSTFHNSPYMQPYMQLLSGANNPDAITVSNFHLSLLNNPSTVKSVIDTISAVNNTRPLGITHAKFLILLSILASPIVPDAKKIKLIKTHAAARRDPYYRLKMAKALSKDMRIHIFT